MKFESNAGSDAPIAGGVLEGGSTAVGGTILPALRDGGWITSARLSVYPKLLIAAYIFTTVCTLLNDGRPGTSDMRLGVDFAPFYVASSLALNGHAALVYDDASQRKAERNVAGYKGAGYETWDYPPTFLLMVLPLSLFSYNFSLVTWILFTLAAYLSVLWLILPDRSAMWLSIAFPASFINMRDGQNGFVSLSLMAGGLFLLERSPVLAGLLLGLLSYKPQFGILIPIVLVATGHWRAFASATATILGLAALTAFVFGWDTWRAFLVSMPITSHRLLVEGSIGFGKMQSVFGVARLWGLSLATSYMLQGSVGLATLGTVLWVWRGPVQFNMKAAALVTGTLLVTPYMVDYDLVLLAAPIAWMAYEALHSEFLPWEKSILFIAWICPLLARPFSLAGVPLTPLVLAIMLAAIVRRSLLASAIDSAAAGAIS